VNRVVELVQYRRQQIRLAIASVSRRHAETGLECLGELRANMKAATIGNFLQRYVPPGLIDKNAIGAVQPLVADDLCNSAFHLECPVEARAGNAQVLGDKAWPQHWIGKVLVDIGEDALAYWEVGWKAFNDAAFGAVDACAEKYEHRIQRRLCFHPVERAAQ